MSVTEMPVSIYGPDGNAPLDACMAIAQALPDYFTPDAVMQMSRDLVEHGAYVVEDRSDREVAGFAVVHRKNGAVAELLWMAVRPSRQRRGYGSALLAAIVEHLRESSAELLEVKTLAPEAGYPPYKGTRRFYERAGFVHLETVDPYPGWAPGNPCAIYVKILHDPAARGG